MKLNSKTRKGIAAILIGIITVTALITVINDEISLQDPSNESEPELGQTGFKPVENLTEGETTPIRLYYNGSLVKGETVYADGKKIGVTNPVGEIQYTPSQDTVTLSTTHSEIEDKKYQVKTEADEPQITLNNPSARKSFETVEGTKTRIEFEAVAKITENTGTARLFIDNNQVNSQELSNGVNSFSTTQKLSAGLHQWKLQIDTPRYTVNSPKRNLKVTETEPREGIKLLNNATAGKQNTAIVYKNNQPLKETQVTLDGEKIGLTDQNGEIEFEVPNEQLIVLKTSKFAESFGVQGYVDPGQVEIIRPEFDAEFTVESGDTATVPVELKKPENASYQILLDGQVVKQGEEGKTVNTEIQVSTGIHGLNIRAITENGQTIKTQDTRIQVNQN